MNFEPSIHLQGGTLTLLLADGSVASWEPLNGFLDKTDFDEVLTLEVLDLKSQLNVISIPPSRHLGLPRWFYDDEIDAFSLAVKEATGRVSTIQVSGLAGLDSSGRLIVIRVPTH